jgi:hypothetical protein
MILEGRLSGTSKKLILLSEGDSGNYSLTIVKYRAHVA